MPDLSLLHSVDSTQVNLVLGALIVPLLLQLLKREHWSPMTCRLVAYGFALLVAIGEAALVTQSPVHLLESSVAIFASATGVYHLFFQGSLGDATQLDLLGKLFGKTITDLTAKNEAAVIADVGEIVAGIERPT